MTFPPLSSDQPASAQQLGTALAALGLYGGTNTAAEHAAEAARLGGPDPYRMRLANALLGAVQVEAMLAETSAADAEGLAAAHHEQLVTAGVADDAEKLVGFLRWQALRVSGPLRLIAQDPATGPIPLAAAHAAEGLQRLLGVAGAGQVPDVETVKEHVAEIEAARECLVTAIGNVDILLQMLSGLSALFGED
ncbi:DUF6245 family protein [Streptosporangium sp. NPDC006013]|uniref:DUF6245 family protein n=1 Tax=Streptosporangium sp. NPDC006013 TaxID=3155596 RepID=UPI0033B40900